MPKNARGCFAGLFRVVYKEGGVYGSMGYGGCGVEILWVMGYGGFGPGPPTGTPPPPPCEKMMVAPSRSHLSGAAGAARKEQRGAAGAARKEQSGAAGAA